VGYTRIDGSESVEPPRRSVRTAAVHLGLFAATFVTCTMAGAQWMMQDPSAIENWSHGLTYAFLILAFLAAHEFGHYVAARIHGVDATLPYFIPIPPALMPFGTFGALIRTRTPITSRTVLFDIGVAGPLAGFVVCLVILGIGIVLDPGPSVIMAVHPDRTSMAENTGLGLTFGDSLLFALLRWSTEGSVFWPPMNEIYHYPFLCVGWFGLFVTALNMLPFGQLDGGHVLHALIGRGQARVARTLWWVMFVFVILAMFSWMHDLLSAQDYAEPWIMWLQVHVDPSLRTAIDAAPWLFQIGSIWAFWLILVRFVVRIEHPPVSDETPLDPVRRAIGWTSIVILILCFPPQGIFVL
jgi:Zn-dependent protease